MNAIAGSNERIAREFFANMRGPREDQATFRRMCTPDFLWENSGLPALRGHDAACEMADAWNVRLGWERTEIEILHLGVDGDTVLVEHFDRFYRGDGSLIFSVELLGRLTLKDGKIIAYRDYFDPTEVLRAVQGEAAA